MTAKMLVPKPHIIHIFSGDQYVSIDFEQISTDFVTEKSKKNIGSFILLHRSEMALAKSLDAAAPLWGWCSKYCRHCNTPCKGPVPLAMGTILGSNGRCWAMLPSDT